MHERVCIVLRARVCKFSTRDSIISYKLALPKFIMHTLCVCIVGDGKFPRWKCWGSRERREGGSQPRGRHQAFTYCYVYYSGRRWDDTWWRWGAVGVVGGGWWKVWWSTAANYATEPSSRAATPPQPRSHTASGECFSPCLPSAPPPPQPLAPPSSGGRATFQLSKRSVGAVVVALLKLFFFYFFFFNGF